MLLDFTTITTRFFDFHPKKNVTDAEFKDQHFQSNRFQQLIKDNAQGRGLYRLSGYGSSLLDDR